jgi:hypothetical protein
MAKQQLERRAKGLEVAITRTIEAGKRSTVTLIHRVGRKAIESEIEITQALLLVLNREDFIGYGTGRNVHSIEFRPIERPAVHAICHRTTTGCMVFWGDQRSAA